MDWNDIKVFAAVAAEGSLSAAARRLKMSQPTVGRHVEALERQLETRLFDRGPRGYMLTQAGRELLPQVEDMERAAYSIRETLEPGAGKIKGTVRLTAPEMTGRFLGRRLGPMIDDLPGVEVEIIATNRLLNMSRREADIAVRAGFPTQGDLRAKKIMTTTPAAYASPEYVARHPEALTEERYRVCRWVDMLRPEPRFYGHHYDEFLDRKGVQPVVRSASAHAGVEAAIGGAGLIMLLAEFAVDLPELIQVSPLISELERPLWMVAHADVLTQPRVRAVWEWLDANLARTPPYLDSGPHPAHA